MNSSVTVTGCDDIIKRLRVAIAEHPLSPIHGYAADIDALTDRLDDFEENGAQAVRWAPSSAHWSNELRRLFGPSARDGIESLEVKLRDATVRLDKAERENERLRAERDEHARWREKLADDLHERESQISDGWVALRDSGVQSEKNIADGIKLLRAENEALAADAQRYRWLRGREDGRYMTVYAFRTDVDEVCLGEELDATIDAAMAAEQPEGKE